MHAGDVSGNEGRWRLWQFCQLPWREGKEVDSILGAPATILVLAAVQTGALVEVCRVEGLRFASTAGQQVGKNVLRLQPFPDPLYPSRDAGLIYLLLVLLGEPSRDVCLFISRMQGKSIGFKIYFRRLPQ